MIVVFGLVDFIPGIEVGALSMMRIFRVLRPLRAINKLPSLRVLIALIFETLPMMGNVVAMCFFVIMVFSILSVQLFQGKLRQRCFKDFQNVANGLEFSNEMNGGHPYLCSAGEDKGMQTCAPDIPGAANYTFCWDAATPNNFAGIQNPEEGVYSFDNVPIAIVVIFIVITMEGWTEIMYMVQVPIT